MLETLYTVHYLYFFHYLYTIDIGKLECCDCWKNIEVAKLIGRVFSYILIIILNLNSKVN